MKKVFCILGLISFLVFILSCNNNENENKLRKAPKEITDVINRANNKTSYKSGPCDGAVSVGISVQTDFEIKRPKYNCTRGFWFCSETHTFIECKDGDGNVIYQEEICRSGNLNQGPHKYKIPLYEMDENNVILSFSKDYFKQGFTFEDFRYFSVDDERLVLPGRTMILGDYEVFDYGDNYVVRVKTNKI